MKTIYDIKSSKKLNNEHPERDLAFISISFTFLLLILIYSLSTFIYSIFWTKYNNNYLFNDYSIVINAGFLLLGIFNFIYLLCMSVNKFSLLKIINIVIIQIIMQLVLITSILLITIGIIIFTSFVTVGDNFNNLYYNNIMILDAILLFLFFLTYFIYAYHARKKYYSSSSHLNLYYSTLLDNLYFIYWISKRFNLKETLDVDKNKNFWITTNIFDTYIDNETYYSWYNSYSHSFHMTFKSFTKYWSISLNILLWSSLFAFLAILITWIKDYENTEVYITTIMFVLLLFIISLCNLSVFLSLNNFQIIGENNEERIRDGWFSKFHDILLPIKLSDFNKKEKIIVVYLSILKNIFLNYSPSSLKDESDVLSIPMKLDVISKKILETDLVNLNFNLSIKEEILIININNE